MRGLSALLPVLVVVIASLVAYSGASTAGRTTDAGIACACQATDAAPDSMKGPGSEIRIRIGCKRGTASTAPTPCTGHGLLVPSAAEWTGGGSAVEPTTQARWLKPYRPTGLLDPPRSA